MTAIPPTPEEQNDHTRGLYGKYTVTRTDGSSAPGCKHEECYYFVLDMYHDKFAAAALSAYARACVREYPELARDLHELAEASRLNVAGEALDQFEGTSR